MIRTVIALIWVVFSQWGMAQERKNSLFATPVVFRTPETGFGGGAAGVYTFYMNKSDSLSPPSQVQAGFAVTQERQFLYYLPFQLFWNQRKWYCYGELGHYDYNYFFFGVGTRTEAQPEYYEVTFTRVRLNALRKVWRNWYVGPRLWIENWQFPFFEPEGELISGRVVGTGGGLTFDPGLIVFNDLRDNVFFPRKGSYLELTTQHAGGAFGFSRYRADVRVYHSIHDHLVWANELFIDHTTGEVPFYMMPMLGGTKRMRGYYEGRFRDQNAALLQTELRARIWRRWGVNAFYSVGMVAQSTKQFMINRTQGAGGAGLRFVLDREKDLNLRFDVAWGRQSTLFYFTVGEAF